MLTYLCVSRSGGKLGIEGEKENDEKLKIQKAAIHRHLLYSGSVSFSPLKKECCSRQFVEGLPLILEKLRNADSPNLKKELNLEKRNDSVTKTESSYAIYLQKGREKAWICFFIYFLITRTNTTLEYICIYMYFFLL